MAAPEDDAPPTPARRPPGRRWNRSAVVLAVALDVVVAIGTIVALMNGFEPIVLAFAAILGVAPWTAIIDESERPRRR